jgi:ADP-glucose pyrophosphorylase
MDDVETIVITDEQIEQVDLYQMLQFHQTEEGVQISVVQVPVPRVLIENFQKQFGEEMAKVNLKLVTYKGQVFLAPVKTSSLIGV